MMKPYQERTIDTQYHDLLTRIMREGREVKPVQGEKAKMVVGHQLRFDMQNGFPLITERDMSGPFLKAALGEHIAFLNGARTQEQLMEFGCKFWDRWITKEKCAIFNLPEGDLGDGSYGAAWATFPTAEGAPFNQIEHVMKQIIERPYLRTHIITPWVPQYVIQHSELTRRTVVAPCHGWIHILTFPETKELAVHHFQRSADVPVGLAFNIVQYAAFGMMVGKLTGYKMIEYVHTLSDAHIYESQYEKVEELLTRESRRFPTMTLNADGIEKITDFRPENFELGDDYEPHPKMLIPTPV
jgi:thymidylate synthase